MNDLYNDPIQLKLLTLEGSLIDITNFIYNNLDNASDVGSAELSNEQEFAVSELKNLCPALLHKLQLLNYRLQTIESFDWQNEFKEGYELKELHNGNMKIQFKNKFTLEHFIYLEISGFLSVLSSIIDIVAQVVCHSFRVNVRNKNYITVRETSEKLEHYDDLKKFLLERFCDDYSFYGMRNLRTQCEHRSHLGIMQWIKSFPGGMNNEARINKTIFLLELSDELKQIQDWNKVDIYCRFLYKKIISYLEEFVGEISSINAQHKVSAN